MKYNTKIVLAYFRDCGLPTPEVEYPFAKEIGRKWRLDFAWPNVWRGKWGAENHDNFPLALEVQGGIFVQGRHTRGAALLKEWEKLNELACQNWRVIYCQPKDLCMDKTVQLIKRALGIDNDESSRRAGSKS